MSGPDGPFFEVVGVTGDSRTGRARQAPPFVYGAHGQVLALGFGGQRMVVMLKTAVAPESVVEEFRRIAAAVDPNVSASNIITMDRFLADLLVADRLTVTVLGVAGALTLVRFASSFLVGVTTTDPASLGVGIAMVIGVTLAAAYVPARRAMRADPVVAMRVE